LIRLSDKHPTFKIDQPTDYIDLLFQIISVNPILKMILQDNPVLSLRLRQPQDLIHPDPTLPEADRSPGNHCQNSIRHLPSAMFGVKLIASCLTQTG
jgi:hypothetical protein